MSDDNFLSRWSRKKLAAKSTPAAPADTELAPAIGKPGAAGVVPAQAGTPSAAADPTPEPPPPLPPVESLTPESDFTPFMRTGVDPGLKRQALKALFQDPRFNVMDGLDVYIDDYSKADPLPEGWLEKMTQYARLGDFRPEEPQTAASNENLPAAAQIPEKSEGEQPVAAPEGTTSSDTPIKGGTATEVPQS